MKLSKLLEEIVADFICPDIEVSGLAIDSRQVKPGDLFFAYAGAITDGRKYIQQAIENGALVILCEPDTEAKFHFPKNKGISIIFVPGLRQLVGHIAAKFYQFPSERMFVIGVTGTNGKTSICQLMAEALQSLGKKSATIGTIGFGIVGEKKQPCNTTTPTPLELQKIFSQFREKHVEVVVMEASSHALDQNRMSGIDFKMGIFTNLTRDHLDYHKTLEAYRDAKSLLFEMPSLKYGIFNLDDSIGLEFIQTFKKRLKVCGYSISSNFKLQTSSSSSQHDYPIVFADHIRLNSEGIYADIGSSSVSDVFHFKTSLLGRFNLSNILAVLSGLMLLGYDFQSIVNVLSRSQTVKGRMQAFGGGDKPLFILDYAHTPDALAKALSALREHCEGRLYCVFGCGGDRDRGKRPMMAKIAEQYSDIVILTDDNVRTEDPKQIFDDICSGFQQPNKVLCQHDRLAAIEMAYAMAKPGEIILLAGKGHEDYQVIGKQKFHFDEAEIVTTLLKQ